MIKVSAPSIRRLGSENGIPPVGAAAQRLVWKGVL
jgi:hypothetical protein